MQPLKSIFRLALPLGLALLLGACGSLTPRPRGEVKISVDVPCEYARVGVEWGSLKFSRTACEASTQPLYGATAPLEGFPMTPLRLRWVDAKGLGHAETLELGPLVKKEDFHEQGTRLTLTVRDTALTVTFVECKQPQATNPACEGKQREGTLLVRHLSDPFVMPYPSKSVSN